MKSLDLHDFPQCTIDFPLEFTPEEMGALSDSLNTLLKSNYLIGSSADFAGTFHSLFDIACEIAEVDCCAYIAGSPDADTFELVVGRHVSLHDGDDSGSLFLPATLARFFNKGVHLQAAQDCRLATACEAWNANSLVAFPIRSNLEFLGVLVFGRKKTRPFTPVEMKLLWILVGQAENVILQNDAVKMLSFYSFLDPLTHLYNRRYFDDLLEKEIFRSRRSGKPVSLLMLDLDGFKAYNDAFHHSAGDIALQEVAAILQACVREVDTVARFGGDEFAIILADSSAHGACDLAARINERLKRHLLPGGEQVRTEHLSASIGVSTFPTDAFDKQDLVRKADHALYTAKHQGGGKVCLHQEIIDLLPKLPETPEMPVQKIYDAARSVVDMDKFLEILLFTAMQGMGAARGSIVVVSPDGTMTIRAAIGFRDVGEQVFSGKSVSAGAVTSWVAAKKEPLLVTGREQAPFPIDWKHNGYQGTSFLSVPLVEGDRVLGVLHLTNRKGNRPFTRDDLAKFAPISGEIASILSKGMVFRESVQAFSTSVLRSLATALELRFPFLTGHSARVRDIALRIGNRMALAEEQLRILGTAAALHDIGMVGIPGEILSKSRKLSPRELEIARKHPFLGAKMLESVPGMKETARIILEHQELFDGSGYPHGLRGNNISPGARIVSLAEFYDAITSVRPHRGGLRQAEALQLVRNNMGTIFDENVCRAFLAEMKQPLAS